MAQSRPIALHASAEAWRQLQHHRPSWLAMGQMLLLACLAAAGVRKVGAGSIYFSSMKDSTGTYLDGGKNYKLNIPGPVPAKLFWSVTVYDSETRTIINTDQGRGAVRMMFEKPTANADGSFDVYFGPDAPTGKENHWVKTISGKGWFTYVRVYGPEEPLFDGTYQLPDIEELK